MKKLSWKMWISVIVLVLATGVMGCSSPIGDDPASEKPTRQFAVKEGKRFFLHLCSPCHGETGSGDGIYWASALDIAPADLTKFTSAQSDTVFKTIKFGSEPQDRPKLCPPWKNNISDEEITHIVAYVETLNDINTVN